MPRLSIVVLPFANLSSNPEQQYFADAITEDVTTDLSRIAHSFVIKRVDTNQIGRDLGVRYVLEGSVRRSANKVRINTQLIDAETDAHLWAEQFDGDIGDLFAKRDHQPHRHCSQPRADQQGGHPVDRAARCARLPPARSRRVLGLAGGALA